MIFGALLDAKKRGVRVRVVLDKSQASAQYSSATFFHNQVVPCFIDSSHAIAHNKVMILDSSTLITGSFNFTKAAEESNAENLLIIRGKAEIAQAYAANFAHHLAHARAYTGAVAEAAAVPATTAAKSVDPGTRVVPRTTTAPARVVDEKSQTTQSVKVFRTASGGKYHRANCSSLRRSSIAIGLSDAKARGLGPCTRCHPPE